jgi:hypothetical protein
MVKVCIFCSKRANSDEHVWPEWLLRIIKQWSGEMVFQAMRLNKRGETIKWNRFDPDIRIGNVCKRCNNGWMSTLEVKAKPILIPMINGTATTLTLEQQATIAILINKCGLIFDTMENGEGTFYNKSDRTHFSQHLLLLEHTKVWVGYYSGPNLRGFTRHGTIARPDSRPPYNLYIMTMAFGRLVLQLINTKFVTSKAREGIRLPVQSQVWDLFIDEILSRQSPGPVSWPLSVSFDDTNYTFDEFSNRFGRLI